MNEGWRVAPTGTCPFSECVFAAPGQVGRTLIGTWQMLNVLDILFSVFRAIEWKSRSAERESQTKSY